jgi:hypothetical protein
LGWEDYFSMTLEKLEFYSIICNEGWTKNIFDIFGDVC